MAQNKIGQSCDMLVIGGSAGSLEILLQLLPEITYPVSFAIVIVLHRKNSSNSGLTDLLAGRTKIPVSEVDDKEPILKNHIYLAPGDYHLLIEKNLSLSLDFSEKINYSRPSIDVAFETAADAYGEKLTCLLLSGANSDGALGLKKVKNAGGRIIVQDPETAGSPQMPWAALLNTNADQILNPKQMVDFINSLT